MTDSFQNIPSKLFAEIQKELASKNDEKSFNINFKLEGNDGEKFDLIADALKKSRTELAKFIIINSLDDMLSHIGNIDVVSRTEGSASNPDLHERLLALAMPKIMALSKGETFELKPLLGDEDWDKIGDHGAKNSAGKVFRKLVDRGYIKNVKYVDRNENRHAIYEKTDFSTEAIQFNKLNIIRTKTCGRGAKQAEFEYSGNIEIGVTIYYGSGELYIAPDFFALILNTFRGKQIKGGFSVTHTPDDGFGYWVQHNNNKLTPRHASHIAAILRDADKLKVQHKGNTVILDFMQ